MMVVDTSALMAVALDEPSAEACRLALADDDAPIVSAGTLAETLIVAERRGVGAEVNRMIDALAIEVAPLTLTDARGVAEAYARWGKGLHPAGLNLGDCFAYQLAKARGCPLLFVGDDFTRTDIERVL